MAILMREGARSRVPQYEVADQNSLYGAWLTALCSIDWAMILLVDRITSALDQQFVGRVDNFLILILIVELIEKESHRVDPSALLVVALDRGPLRILSVSGQQHRFLGSGVVVPPSQ